MAPEMGMTKPDGVCAVTFCQVMLTIGATSLSILGRGPCQGTYALLVVPEKTTVRTA
jgi:hypothetical protein